MTTGFDGSSAPFTDTAGVTPGRTTLATNTNGEISERTNFRTSVINLERPGDPSVFGDAIRADAANLVSRYPVGQARSALLPMLHLVQSEQGHITPDGIAFCSDVLGITKAQVSAVATFYTMYKRVPTGEYLVSICTNTLCGMMGGDEIFTEVAHELGIGHNETTADGSITIERAECLAACDYAPVVTVNYEFYDKQTVDSTQELVGELRAGRRPAPTRGAPLCSFKQAERQIAGFFTTDDYALESAATGAPSEAGVRLAIERGDTAPSYAADSVEPKPAAMADSAARQSRKPSGKSPAGSSKSGRTRGASAAETAHREGPSESDAPLETAESDSSNTTDPSAEKGD